MLAPERFHKMQRSIVMAINNLQQNNGSFMWKHISIGLTITFENRFSFYCLSPRPPFILLPFFLSTILRDQLVIYVHYVNEAVEALKFLRKLECFGHG